MDFIIIHSTLVLMVSCSSPKYALVLNIKSENLIAYNSLLIQKVSLSMEDTYSLMQKIIYNNL